MKTIAPAQAGMQMRPCGIVVAHAVAVGVDKAAAGARACGKHCSCSNRGGQYRYANPSQYTAKYSFHTFFLQNIELR